MNTDGIILAIDTTDFSPLQKNVMKGFVKRAEEQHIKQSLDRTIVEEFGDKKVNEIVLSTDDLKIYTITGKDEWDIKYPFRSIYKDEKGNWNRVSTVSPSLDVAFLSYVECKHLGLNSNFTNFALKMLDIKID